MRGSHVLVVGLRVVVVMLVFASVAISAPQIVSFCAGGAIGWRDSAYSGSIYRVETTAQLGNGWTPLVSGVEANGPTGVVPTDAHSTPACFYRIVASTNRYEALLVGPYLLSEFGTEPSSDNPNLALYISAWAARLAVTADGAGNMSAGLSHLTYSVAADGSLSAGTSSGIVSHDGSLFVITDAGNGGSGNVSIHIGVRKRE